jgi:hypothetical protein
VLLDGEAVGFRDGVLPPRLAFDVAAAALLGCLLFGKSRRGLPFLLTLPESCGNLFLLFDGLDDAGDDSTGLLFQARGRGVAPGETLIGLGLPDFEPEAAGGNTCRLVGSCSRAP